MNSPRRRLAGAGISLVFIFSACGEPRRDENQSTAGSPAPSADPAGDLPALILTPVEPPPSTAAPPGGSRRKPARPAAPAPVRGTQPPAAVIPPVPAAAGTFTFEDTGITRIRGCVTLDQPPPSPSKLVVGPASGNRQHLDRDQRDPLGAGSMTSIDVEYRPDGLFLTGLRQTQTSLLSSQPTEFRPVPPVLLLPASAARGQTWSFSLSSVDGSVKIDSQNRVEALAEPVTLGSGRVVQTTRVLAEGRVFGQSSQGTLDLTRKMTTWYSPESGLPVKEVTDMKGRIGLCEIDSHVEAILESF